MCVRPENADRFASWLSALGRLLNLEASGEIRASCGTWIGEHSGYVASVDDLPALRPSAWSKLDDVVGSAHGFGIVFDDNDAIAKVAKADNRVEKV